jgi:hypothetical protein
MHIYHGYFKTYSVFSKKSYNICHLIEGNLLCLHEAILKVEYFMSAFAMTNASTYLPTFLSTAEGPEAETATRALQAEVCFQQGSCWRMKE